MRINWLATMLAALLLPVATAQAQDKVVKIYNWSDYIDPAGARGLHRQDRDQGGLRRLRQQRGAGDQAARRQHGLRPRGADRLFSRPGRSRPASSSRWTESKIPNWENLDPALMEQAAKYDPGNEHAFIYMWGTTGLAYNVDKIKERMPDAPLDSWALLFDPAVAAKLADCGIMMLDAPTRCCRARLRYHRRGSGQQGPGGAREGCGRLCRAIRPYIRKFHSSEIHQRAGQRRHLPGADVLGRRRHRARRAPRRPATASTSSYVIPKEGAQLWFDMMAMPTDAPDPDNAYAFMNYLLAARGDGEDLELRHLPERGAGLAAADRARR